MLSGDPVNQIFDHRLHREQLNACVRRQQRGDVRRQGIVDRQIRPQAYGLACHTHLNHGMHGAQLNLWRHGWWNLRRNFKRLCGRLQCARGGIHHHVAPGQLPTPWVVDAHITQHTGAGFHPLAELHRENGQLIV